MSDNVILAKAETIGRCVRRAREERAAAGAAFVGDYTRQDAAVLNVQRACEAAVDIAHRIVRLRALGLPASHREAFDLIASADLITVELADALKRMVGFRNVAVHQYAKLDLAVLERVIDAGLDDLLAFTAAALRL
jgi:uncharacterized protein YutE (UPF0331/DUF86 family)